MKRRLVTERKAREIAAEEVLRFVRLIEARAGEQADRPLISHDAELALSDVVQRYERGESA